MILAASHADRSERRVNLAQGSGVLLVHLGGHYKHGILHRVEVGNVHHRLVHHRVLGNVVHGQKDGDVVHHELGVVAHRDQR